MLVNRNEYLREYQCRFPSFVWCARVVTAQARLRLRSRVIQFAWFFLVQPAVPWRWGWHRVL